MNTKIFFAFDERIPNGILSELAQFGAETRQVEYDPFLGEEICFLNVNTKQSLIKVMQYFQNLNDFKFKYYQPITEKLQVALPE